MKKRLLNLLTLVSLMLVCGVNPIWADDPVATGTVGLTQTIDEDAKKIGPNTLSGLSDAAGEIDYITIGKAAYGKNISDYTGTPKDVSLNGTVYTTTDSWRKSQKNVYDEQYVGYDLGINADYQVNLKKLNARILIADDTYTWYVEVLNASDQKIYKSAEKTTKKASTALISDDLTTVEGLTGLTGSIKVRLWVKQGGSTKYFTIDRLTLDLDVMPDTRTRYTVKTTVVPEGAGTVSPSGETKFVVGSNVPLTATAAPGYKFSQWTINGESTSANPYIIENISENYDVIASFMTLPKITFSAGEDESVVGTAPSVAYVELGENYTIPVSYFLTKKGYTLTGWTDGTNVYNVGQEITITGDLALTPVFTENATTLKKGASNVEWLFAPNAGAPIIVCENSTMYYVKQATIDGNVIDVPMFINTLADAGVAGSTGKVNNSTQTDRAQVNKGTIFEIPAVKGMTVTYTYTNGAPTVEAVTFNGAFADAVDTGAKTISYTYNGDAETLAIIDQGLNLYPSKLAVAYPEPVIVVTKVTVNGTEITFAEDNTYTDATEYTEIPVVKYTVDGGEEQTADVVASGDNYVATIVVEEVTYTITFTNVKLPAPAPVVTVNGTEITFAEDNTYTDATEYTEVPVVKYTVDGGEEQTAEVVADGDNYVATIVVDEVTYTITFTNVKLPAPAPVVTVNGTEITFAEDNTYTDATEYTEVPVVKYTVDGGEEQTAEVVASGDNYVATIVVEEVTYTITFTNVKIPLPVCETPSFNIGDFSFAHHAKAVTFNAAEGQKLMVTVDDAEAVEMASPAVVYPLASAKAYAFAEGYENSDTTEVTVENNYDANKPYVAWVYTSTYTSVAEGFADDKILNALKDEYNVVLVDYVAEVTPSEDLNNADLIVCTEAMSGAKTMSNGMQAFVGVTPMISFKMFNYSSGRWSWGTPNNPGMEVVGVTPVTNLYDVLKGVAYEKNGDVNFYDAASELFNIANNHIQTVDITSAPVTTTVMATASDGKTAMFCAEKYFCLGLSSDNWQSYNNNAVVVVSNAARMLLDGTALDKTDVANAINEVKASDTLSGEAIYTLSGVRVAVPQKGQLYIMNGKKYIAK